MLDDTHLLSYQAFTTALQTCASLFDLKSARKVHAEIIQQGLQSDVDLGAMLVRTYAICGSLVDVEDISQMWLL